VKGAVEKATAWKSLKAGLSPLRLEIPLNTRAVRYSGTGLRSGSQRILSERRSINSDDCVLRVAQLQKVDCTRKGQGGTCPRTQQRPEGSLILRDREKIPWIGNLNAARKLTGQVVKGGSEIVGHIAKQEPNLGVNSRNVTQDELRSIRFRIELGNACVSVGTDEGRVGNNILEGQRNRWPS